MTTIWFNFQEHMALTTRDLKVRKTNLLTQRSDSPTSYIEDLYPETKTLEDLHHKDIVLKDVVL